MLLAAVALAIPSGSYAIDFQSLVSPGKLIAGHADVESDCKRCHSPFDRESEGKLCLDCHKDVAADLVSSAGFHGSQPAGSIRTCRGCHSEHKGRRADIVGLDAETFDHRQTDYPLAGAHRGVACKSCHPAKKKHREAPGNCEACHSKDDPHRGRLGKECSKCHSENQWREARFDHGLTKFPLEGGHVGVDCALCHPAEKYKKTIMTCRGCHSVDDVHRGRLGGNCADCHDAMSWKRGRFDHDGKTKFPLRGKHQKTSCASCHGTASGGRTRAGAAAKGAGDMKLDMACVSCHRADDEHRGRYGDKCGDCHDAADWKRVEFDHLRDAKLALTGAHRELACESCHRGGLREEKLGRDCNSCHAGDDVHRSQEGERCESCHDSSSWTGKLTFDHELTRFPLLGLHAIVPCEECHAAMTFQDAPEACAACHTGDDVHKSSLGEDCATCHNPNGWALWRFDHRRQTRFDLKGAHENLDCRGCHDSPTSGAIRLETDCESCHGGDDPHRGSFGSRCEDCHIEVDWRQVQIGR
jgi:hypothetical protein